VDMVFTMHAQLIADGMRWPGDQVDGIKAEMVRRAGLQQFEDMLLDQEGRRKMMAAFEVALTDLAAMLKRDASGPFLLGTQPSFADITIGGWLRMYEMAAIEGEFGEMKGWHDGVFGRLHEALQEKFGKVQ
jgi:glutathione S-transferase